MQTAKRLEKVKEYYFSRKLKEIARLKSAGYDVLNLAIGSPDLPPHPSVIKSLQDAAISGPNGYQSYQGLPELRGAISDFYKSKYNVALNPEEEVSAEDIRAFCRERIAHFKVPTYVQFVDDFPMTVTGKIQKFKMRDAMMESLGLAASA